MAQDRWDELESKLAKIRQETESGFAQRAELLSAAQARWEAGEEAARIEVRREAHKLRGVARDPLLSDAAGLLETKCDAGASAAEVSKLSARVAQIAREIADAASHGAAATPAHVPAATPGERAEGASPRAGAAGEVTERARILIVDDDDAIRRLHATALSRLGGFEVADVGAPEDAVPRAQELDPALVLVDAMMPGTNGNEVCAALRAALGDRVQLVIVSAATPKELGWDGDQHYDAWWRKPLSAKDLVARARALLA